MILDLHEEIVRHEMLYERNQNDSFCVKLF